MGSIYITEELAVRAGDFVDSLEAESYRWLDHLASGRLPDCWGVDLLWQQFEHALAAAKLDRRDPSHLLVIRSKVNAKQATARRNTPGFWGNNAAGS